MGFFDFSEFEDLLRSYPTSKFANYHRDYAAKASIAGRIACECLIEQEKAVEELSKESRKLKRNFDLAQAANLDLEKKVAELAEALKRCQDDKKIANDALDRSKKDLEKLQKTHDDDLRLIENLRKDHDKSTKAAEDLRTNNADLAKSLSSKEQKIQDLEKVLADQRETSGKNISEINNKLKLLFKEYEKSLMNFGVRPAPLPADLGISDFRNGSTLSLKHSLKLSLVLVILLRPSRSKVF
jgi:chromosome segregation ATPase